MRNFIHPLNIGLLIVLGVIGSALIALEPSLENMLVLIPLGVVLLGYGAILYGRN